MEQPRQSWPPVPGIQKIPESEGLVTIRTNQAVDLGPKFAKTIIEAMRKLRKEGEDMVRERDPLQTHIKSYRGWRTKAEFDLVQAGIAGTT